MHSFINTIFILIFVAFFLSSCDEPLKTSFGKTDSLAKGITPDQIGWKVEVRFIDTSFTKAILNSGRTRVYQTRMETFLDDGLVVQFFSKRTNKRVSRLTADSAVIDDRTKNMVAKGNVRVVADSSGTVLETSVLHWDNKTQKIYTTEFVKINSINESIQGYGFESDQNLTNYKIFKVSGIQR